MLNQKRNQMLKKVLNLPKKLANFIRGVFAELKFVQWIKGSDVLKYTVFLMLFLIFGSLAIMLIDRVFLLIRELILPV